MSISRSSTWGPRAHQWSGSSDPFIGCAVCVEVESAAYAEDVERSKTKTSYGLLEEPTVRTYSLDTECLVKVTEKKGGDKESLRPGNNKLPLDLIPPEAIEGEARVLAFGAKKYAAHNWKKGLPYAEVLAAIDRHSLAIKKGEDRDPETGELHTWHIKCEASFLGYFMTRPDLYMEFDNRAFKSFPSSVDPNAGQREKD